MKRPLIIHPYLFAIFPVLFIFAYNEGQVGIGELFAPIAIIVISAFILSLISNFFIKNHLKSAIVVSIFFILFFSYWHIGSMLRIKMSIVLVFLSGFFILIVILIRRVNNTLYTVTRILNSIAIFIVAMQVTRIIWDISTEPRPLFIEAKPQAIGVKKYAILPDIYYIILDAYARGDTLKDVYGYDNSDFYRFLTKKGFYIAERSTANYPFTALSLTSSLNFTYLDRFEEFAGKTHKRGLGVLSKSIYDNQVFSLLRKQGYNISSRLFIGGEYYPLELSFFHAYILSSTPLSRLFCYLFGFEEISRRSILSSIDFIKIPIDSSRPNFVLVHVYCPHPPFVFDKNGGNVKTHCRYVGSDASHWKEDSGCSTKDYITLYRDQLTFLTSRIKETVDAVLSFNKNAIIILQSDHGSGAMFDFESLSNSNLKERFGILNAYYFPGRDYSGLYPGISPVNTFRLIFNRYFGTNYELLEDRAYYSVESQPFKFTDVTKEVAGGENLEEAR